MNPSPLAVSNASSEAAKSVRLPFLDELRGLCALLMVLYHAFYTLGFYFYVEWGQKLFHFFLPVEPFFAGTFIFICGLCCPLSRSNAKRGGLLLLVALAVSAVMYIGFPEDRIWFGVLHLLSVCILLYAFLKKYLYRIPMIAGLVINSILFILCFNLPVQEHAGFFGFPGVFAWPVPATVFEQHWLYPLGLGRIGGFQGDYFPLFPWMFCFFAGSFTGRPVASHLMKRKSVDTPPVRWVDRSHIPSLSFLGRHALWIYILHQPVIFLLCYLLFSVF